MDHEENLDQQAQQGHQVLVGMWDPLGHADHLVNPFEERMANQGHQASQDPSVHKDHKACGVNKASVDYQVHRDHPVLEANLALSGLWDLLDSQAHLGVRVSVANQA